MGSHTFDEHQQAVVVMTERLWPWRVQGQDDFVFEGTDNAKWEMESIGETL